MTIRPAQALVVDAERRQGVQDEGHLRDHAGHADVLGTPTQGRTDLGRVEKTQEGVLGVGARGDDARIDLLAARQGDAFHGASLGADGRDVDTASHRRAVASCGSEKRLDQAVRPAPGEDGAPRRSSTRGRVPQEVERRPRRSRAHGGVANAPRPEHATQRFVVDCLAHEIRDGHGQDSQRLVDLPLAKMPQCVREREALEAVRGQTEPPDPEARSPGRASGTGRESGPCGRTRETPRRLCGRRVRSSVAVRAGSRHNVMGGPSADGAKATTSGSTARSPYAPSRRSRTTLARRPPRPSAPIGARTPGATSSVASAPPARLAAFENECAQPSLRQVARRHQAVVAGADDDRVVSLPGHEFQAALRVRSERTTWRAARRPDAPMIPPPGCVAEPHIQRFRSGVR